MHFRAGIQCERCLMTLVYNLKQVLNSVSFRKLMAALDYKSRRRRLPTKNRLCVFP